MGMLELFYTSAEALKEILGGKLRKAREKLRWTPDDLDARLRLGANAPRCAEFEKDPSLLTSDIVTRAAFAMRLNIDTLFEEVNLSKGKVMKSVLKDMKLTGATLAAASSKNVIGVKPETQAPIYAIFRVLDEMDEAKETAVSA